MVAVYGLARKYDLSKVTAFEKLATGMTKVATLQLGFSALQGVQIYKSDYINKGDLYTKMAIDMAVTIAAVAIGGPVGFLICTTYFIVDAGGRYRCNV